MKLEYYIEDEPQRVLDDINTILRECLSATGLNDAGELETLSRASVQLPALLNSLGYYLAIAEIEMDTAKDKMDYERDKRIEKLLHDTDLPYNKAEVAVKTSEQFRDIVRSYLKKKKTYRLLKLKYLDVDRSFEGQRSRLSVIKNDLRRNDE